MPSRISDGNYLNVICNMCRTDWDFIESSESVLILKLIIEIDLSVHPSKLSIINGGQGEKGTTTLGVFTTPVY